MSNGKSKKVKDTKQQFEYVEEPQKFHVKPLKCMNAKQKEFVKAVNDHEVTIVSGIAGCGKTYLACAIALKMLEKKKIDKIILVKSVTEIPGEELGFRPGTEYEKISVFMMSYFGNIDKIIGHDQRKALVNEGKIQLQPLSTIRGVQFDKSFVIIDECQNITMDTFKSIITRIGQDSIYCIMGDTEQVDLKNKKNSALIKIMEIFKDDPLIGIVEFTDTDCVRNKIITPILNKLRSYEESKGT
ncbi:MAG: PhoH-like phosphate starvation-inducible [Wendovervirus sonii]|uniref:PhoH-like protein n=1 Tax=phage Lak_Megaphage_Sonny TaxID=3109229 RepID=A0ABZ0Z7G1_9CAUD|nr:MAG: PhoH-like phosphate starvation-inducible [phage Lak_Megaphage_Sonny]